MCNARTVLPLWAVVVPVNVCNATRYGVRGQRYDNSVYHDGPFGVFKVHSTVVEFILVSLRENFRHVLDLPALLRVPAFARLQVYLRHTGAAKRRPSSLGACRVEHTVHV